MTQRLSYTSSVVLSCVALLSTGCTPQMSTQADTAQAGSGGVDTGPVDTGPATATTLTSVSAWTLTAAEDDLFATERPDPLDCPEWGYEVEDGSFEVETDLCSYGAFSQPLLADLHAGDVLQADLWHDQLWAAEAAEAHIAFGIGGQILWEAQIAIPADPAVYRVEVEAPMDAAAGTTTWLHVHNHGANSYNFMPLVRLASPHDETQ